jgi:hypothetical protein
LMKWVVPIVTLEICDGSIDADFRTLLTASAMPLVASGVVGVFEWARTFGLFDPSDSALKRRATASVLVPVRPGQHGHNHLHEPICHTSNVNSNAHQAAHDFRPVQFRDRRSKMIRSLWFDLALPQR